MIDQPQVRVTVEANGERVVLAGRDARLVSELVRCLETIRAADAGKWSIVWNHDHVHPPRIEVTVP